MRDLRILFDHLFQRLNYFNTILAIIIIFASVACQPTSPAGEVEITQETLLTVSSPAFSDGQEIPGKYTCDGEDLSVPLAWFGVPEGIQSIVLIVDDPDAPGGVFVHWVLYDLPADISMLEEGAMDIGTQGVNGFRNNGYNGPCPPTGPAHRYYFKVYALDTTLGLQPGASKAQVEDAMQGHILVDGQLMGTYQR